MGPGGPARGAVCAEDAGAVQAGTIVTESTPPSAAPQPSSAAAKSKKKKTQAELQRELRDLSKPAKERPPVDLKKIYLRVGLILAAVWIVAILIPTWIPKAVAGAITLAVAGAGFGSRG